MIFSYFKHYFIFCDVNEHLAVPFDFSHWITCLSIPSHAILILLIVWNLPWYLHFAFCLVAWLIKLNCTSYLSQHWDYFRRSFVILTGQKGGPCSPKLLRGPNLVGALTWMGETKTPLLPCNVIWKFVQCRSFL